jgi:hypothetical protein
MTRENNQTDAAINRFLERLDRALETIEPAQQGLDTLEAAEPTPAEGNEDDEE